MFISRKLEKKTWVYWYYTCHWDQNWVF